MDPKLTLMERAGERMNVPPDKVQAFLDDGWRIVGQPVAPDAEPPATPPAEEPVSDVGKKPGKRTAKK